MHYVKDFDINGVVSRQVACIELHGKPNAATEGALGALGIDVDSPVHDVYKCVAVNGSIYTWELLSSGLSIISGTISGSGAEFMEFPYINLLTPAMYVVKIGDMILDSKGYLYQIDAIYSTYCTAKYQGTQLRSYVANGVHIGENEPVNGEVLWIDTDEDPEESGGGESDDNGGTQIDVVANPGQVIAVKSVDENGKPVEYKAVDLPKVPTPNWNANEGEGYIEGRTHYVDKDGIVHKLDNKYLDIDWFPIHEEGYGGETVIFPEQKVSSIITNRKYDLYPGIVYDVHIGGVIYACTAHNNGGTVYLGNPTLGGGSASLPHNNEPFCLQWFGGTATSAMFSYDKTISSSASIKVTDHRTDDYYNEMPEGFLPKCAVKTVNGKAPDANGNVEVKDSFYVDISAGNSYSCSTKVSTLEALLDTDCLIVAKITTDAGALFAQLCSYETSADNSYGRIVMFALGALTFTLTPTSSGSYKVTVSGD